MRKLALHWQILLMMVFGVVFGAIGAYAGFKPFIVDWIKPFGSIFINALKLIAIPLVIGSLIKGVADLKDISSLSAIGFRALGMFLFTTVMAITIGLVIVNVVRPGFLISESTRQELVSAYSEQASGKIQLAEKQKAAGPLQPLVDLVPDNFFKSATENSNMLQVIVFALFFGVALVMVPKEKAQPVKDFFDGFNEVVLKMVDIIMLFAPYGVFALLAALVVESPSIDLFKALIGYAICVLLGIAILLFVFYPVLVRFLAGMDLKQFFGGMAPTQMIAFSSSSSAAALPVNLERTIEKLGVDEEVASFVLPVGATVNMDGTSLYQAVAAVFIAQAFGMELSLQTQLGIILTATLASIGAAPVPGAGMVMLVIVLAQAGIPEAGLALILAIDRPLDMCRTVANVTSDATVATIVAKWLGKLKTPLPHTAG
ncbi:dicarboxylate/amino acid:cation symporter [Sphingobacteriales bacterium UPWRP_1]|nr:dicarboxylate/amino acid:cation symporter [Sphingobacteriales bacterium TSM_CSM]PSJ76166.1 dicarboxylate/amino acid:cation symporter [Sphingobacteriales bacterium UPWRP_1]